MLPGSKVDFRLLGSALLLAVAAAFTWQTIEGLETRRKMRTELAEIGHVRYDLLNADRWVQRIVPVLDAKIDALDLTAADQASLRPTVESALYRLLDNVKESIGGNAMIGNMLMGALRPHVPEYAGVVLKELGRPENKAALKKYIKSTLAASAKGTFGNVDMHWHDYILQRYGCTDTAACRQEIGGRIARADAEIRFQYLTVLGASALAFLLLMTGGVLGRWRTLALLLFCVVLLAGGVLTPMLEVEAKISQLSMTFMGSPISFSDQVLYFQSKSVLEVFRALVTTGKPDMWIVGVLVLTFSVIFPVLKTFTVALCLFRPELLKGNRLVKFLALESSRWSMADVMALAIFMSFVAFNGLIANTMGGLKEIGAQLVIPTESSKILPGYHLFIGFCLASLLLSKKLDRGIR
jgi:Paraquat-inducible protein A